MSQENIITIVFEPYGIKSRFTKGIVMLRALKEVGLNIRSECGGRGICGKCKIFVQNTSNLSKTSDSERKRLSGSELKSGYRLACACSALKDVTLFIPEESCLTTRKLLIQGTERTVKLEPVIHKLYIEMPKPSLSDNRSDVQRLKDSLKDIYDIKVSDIDYRLLKRLSKILREANWNVTVIIWNEEEIISVESGDTTEKAYGIAIDIGTSKIISYLVDLANGKLIATGSLENPQMIHGEDIISRITYASQSDSSLKELQKLVVKGVNETIIEASKESKVNLQYVYEITLVGNTAMHHIFLGLEPRYLGLAPYVPVTNSPVDKKARDFSIKANVANLHVLPAIAGFVGADAVADIIATGIHESEALSMMVDIGTNTEVILGNNQGIVACSCASGPAFEGMHVKCGMKATTGGVEKLQMTPKYCLVSYGTIGNVKPRGLCGSGIIDAIANLVKCQVIDKNGRFTSTLSSSRLKTIEGEKSFILIPKAEATRDIIITQKDIREIQLAKAAIYTGCYILMKKKNVELSDIKKFFVAGAFGNYINLENAKYIGMLPDVPRESITFVGNSAGTGARIALISKSQRRIADSLNQKVDYLELGLDPDFQKEFVSATCFPHKNLDRFPSLKNAF